MAISIIEKASTEQGRDIQYEKERIIINMNFVKKKKIKNKNVNIK